ncbi:MAG: UvrD-helicase domain-containing protein [Bryobacteraceae bacterium]|nr:UvrD-helicase domain-containing protein [Bryobacteraceae bacterium]
MPLSPQQQAAVERTGQDVCCAAGPGSGKTRVLVERFAWLVEQGTPPERVLAITFTDKAATEIKQRLARRFAVRPDLRESIERAPVSTVHGFCARILREYALDAGLDPGFRVMDELEAETLRAQAMDAVLDHWAIDRTLEFRALVDAWACHRPAAHLRCLHEALRKSGGIREQLREMVRFDARGALDGLAAEALELTRAAQRNTENRRRKIEAVEEWLARREGMDALSWVQSFAIDRKGLAPEDSRQAERVREARDHAVAVLAGALNEAQRDTLRDLLIEFDGEYRKRRAAEAGADFHDLEERALALLNDGTLAQREISARFDAVLMDELQDTNPLQWRILERLRRPGRFFAVGDLNQSIYGFRHADPSLFQDFEESLTAAGLAVDRLETNYRSRPEILDFAAAVAGVCAGIRPHALRARESPFPPKAQPCVEIQRYEPGEDADADGAGSEAQWIAWRLEQLKGELLVGDPPRPVRWKDMAVLARTATAFDTLEDAFAGRGIPYTVRRGRNFFDEPEVIDLTNLLRVLANPGDEIAMYALLRSPFFGIADQRLYEAHAVGEFPPPEAAGAIAGLLNVREDMPPDRLIARFLDERGYLCNQRAGVRANADKFVRLLRGWHESAPGQWRRWLDDLAVLREAGQEPNAPSLEDEDAVELTTIHKAKGLEFPVVVIAFLHRLPMNESEPLGWSPVSGLGVAWRLDGSAKGVPDAILNAARQRKREREDLESHRVLYVGLTRAEEHLVISWTRTRNASGWVGLVERALGMAWPDAAGTPWLHQGVRMSMLSGAPPAPASGGADSPRTHEFVEIKRMEPGVEAAPAVGVTPLVYFSECPRRHFLTYAAGWPQFRDVQLSTGARELGEEVHRLLAGLPVETPSSEALELRERFLRSDLGQRMKNAAHVEREFDFMFSLDGTLLRGVIDLWIEDGDGVTLVDYKTGHSIPPETMETYKDQLRFYALALEALTGRLPRRVALFLLHQDRAVEVGMDEHPRARCRDVLAGWLEAQSRNEWPARPGNRCEWCPYEGAGCEGRARLALPDSPL